MQDPNFYQGCGITHTFTKFDIKSNIGQIITTYIQSRRYFLEFFPSELSDIYSGYNHTLTFTAFKQQFYEFQSYRIVSSDFNQYSSVSQRSFFRFSYKLYLNKVSFQPFLMFVKMKPTFQLVAHVALFTVFQSCYAHQSLSSSLPSFSKISISTCGTINIHSFLCSLIVQPFGIPIFPSRYAIYITIDINIFSFS